MFVRYFIHYLFYIVLITSQHCTTLNNIGKTKYHHMELIYATNSRKNLSKMNVYLLYASWTQTSVQNKKTKTLFFIIDIRWQVTVPDLAAIPE